MDTKSAYKTLYHLLRYRRWLKEEMARLGYSEDEVVEFETLDAQIYAFPGAVYMAAYNSVSDRYTQPSGWLDPHNERVFTERRSLLWVQKHFGKGRGK